MLKEIWALLKNAFTGWNYLETQEKRDNKLQDFRRKINNYTNFKKKYKKCKVIKEEMTAVKWLWQTGHWALKQRFCITFSSLIH